MSAPTSPQPASSSGQAGASSGALPSALGATSLQRASSLTWGLNLDRSVLGAGSAPLASPASTSSTSSGNAGLAGPSPSAPPVAGPPPPQQTSPNPNGGGPTLRRSLTSENAVIAGAAAASGSSKLKPTALAWQTGAAPGVWGGYQPPANLPSPEKRAAALPSTSGFPPEGGLEDAHQRMAQFMLLSSGVSSHHEDDFDRMRAAAAQQQFAAAQQQQQQQQQQLGLPPLQQQLHEAALKADPRRTVTFYESQEAYQQLQQQQHPMHGYHAGATAYTTLGGSEESFASSQPPSDAYRSGMPRTSSLSSRSSGGSMAPVPHSEASFVIRTATSANSGVWSNVNPGALGKEDPGFPRTASSSSLLFSPNTTSRTIPGLSEESLSPQQSVFSYSSPAPPGATKRLASLPVGVPSTTEATTIPSSFLPPLPSAVPGPAGAPGLGAGGLPRRSASASLEHRSSLLNQQLPPASPRSTYSAVVAAATAAPSRERASSVTRPAPAASMLSPSSQGSAWTAPPTYATRGDDQQQQQQLQHPGGVRRIKSSDYSLSAGAVDPSSAPWAFPPAAWEQGSVEGGGYYGGGSYDQFPEEYQGQYSAEHRHHHHHHSHMQHLNGGAMLSPQHAGDEGLAGSESGHFDEAPRGSLRQEYTSQQNQHMAMLQQQQQQQHQHQWHQQAQLQQLLADQQLRQQNDAQAPPRYYNGAADGYLPHHAHSMPDIGGLSLSNGKPSLGRVSSTGELGSSVFPPLSSGNNGRSAYTNAGGGAAAAPQQQQAPAPSNFHGYATAAGGMSVSPRAMTAPPLVTPASQTTTSPRASNLGIDRGSAPATAVSSPVAAAGGAGLLAEHKLSGRRLTLEELRGHICEFSYDSQGSRLVQHLMEASTPENRQIIVQEVLPSILPLSRDLFGNYVIQNLFDHSPPALRDVMAQAIMGSVGSLCTHAHGCRVIQRALQVSEAARRNDLFERLLLGDSPRSSWGLTGESVDRDALIRVYAKDSHATHVLQKAVAQVQLGLGLVSNDPAGELDPPHEQARSAQALECVERAVLNDCVAMMLHQNASRLVQRVLCNLNRDKCGPRVREIVRLVFANIDALAVHQNANFVLQHLLEHDPENEGTNVQTYVAANAVRLARHKFGSHLVEKCLASATNAQACTLIDTFLAPPGVRDVLPGDRDFDRTCALPLLMADPYANFVVQKAFDVSTGEHRERLSHEIRSRSAALSKFPFGRHILTHINRLTPTASGQAARGSPRATHASQGRR